ncbi:hypothetical protein GCM10011380_00340 [Sphingomonas metalli]|uniref:Uncharacterized protein n=1 Tax=Sphingomonas metalli TaxID=1779358 RepID=A0A916STC6_9SPHN|nr:hypothetical protein [Sphingomonas metalli]GGB14865.1 hypothetical protein GCM10011380_00340 [Sphingomonas metalli]
MGDYLDAGQTARLECLKLAMTLRDLTPQQKLEFAHQAAAFVGEGKALEQEDAA